MANLGLNTLTKSPSTGVRIGNGSSIQWREHINPNRKFLLDLSLIRDAVRAGPELNSNVWHRPSGTRVIKLVTIFANRIAAESASVHGANSGRHRHLWIRRADTGATKDGDFYLVTSL